MSEAPQVGGVKSWDKFTCPRYFRFLYENSVDVSGEVRKRCYMFPIVCAAVASMYASLFPSILTCEGSHYKGYLLGCV